MRRNGELLEEKKIVLREDMQVYSDRKLTELYSYSFENGYTDYWKPKKVII